MTDSSGKTLVSIEQKLMSLLPRYEISIGGKTVCEVTKKVTFFKPKFVISGLNWEIDGDLWRDEFQLTDGENDFDLKIVPFFVASQTVFPPIEIS